MTKAIIGIGFFEAMFLLFLGLKLGKVIDWSWWWVTAPLWAPILIAIIVVLFILLIIFLYYFIKYVFS